VHCTNVEDEKSLATALEKLAHARAEVAEP
jgi:hypothetical protein